MDDLISRQAAMSIPLTPKEHRNYKTLNLDDAYDEGWEDYQACIALIPPAQPVVTCEGCRFVGTYDTDFPCCSCVRKEKDYYEPER